MSVARSYPTAGGQLSEGFYGQSLQI